MARRVIAEFDAVTGPFLAKMDRIDRSINRFERSATTSFARSERGINRMVLGLGRLQTGLGLIAGGFGVGLAARFLDETALIRNALREAGDTSEETFNRVQNAASATLSGFRNTAQAVQRFQRATQMTQPLERTIRQVETLNRLFALSGRTTQERQSTLIQFSQALQAGYLGGEELRSIRENAPIDLVRAIAREAGGTIEELKDLSAQGLLTTDVMIRALESLETEAVERFGAIEVTIQDAATVFANGALVIGEAFDDGLGLSRATVANLTKLGEILGENAEAARIFGQAVKVAGAALVTSFAGRQINRATAGFRELAQARRTELNAANEQLFAARRDVIVRQGNLDVSRRQTEAMIAQGRAQTSVSRAIQRETRRRVALNQANIALEASQMRVVNAQRQMLISSRAMAAAGNLLRGTFAFLGGWPGLILAAGAAFFAIRGRINEAREAQAELLNVSNEYVGLIQNIQEARAEITRMVGSLSEGESGVNTLVQQAEIQLQQYRVMLRQMRQEEQANQIERLRLLEQAQTRYEDLTSQSTRRLEQIARDQIDMQNRVDQGFLSPEVGQRQIEAMEREARAIRELDLVENDAIREARQDVEELEAAVATAGVALRRMAAEWFEFNNAGSEGTGNIQQFEAALAAVEEHLSGNRSEAEQLQATYDQLSAYRATLITRMDEESDTVMALDAAMEDLAAEIAQAGREASGTAGAVISLGNAMRALQGVRIDLTGQLRQVRTQIAAARSGVDAAVVEAMGGDRQVAQQAIAAGFPPRAVEAQVEEARRLRVELAGAQDELQDLINPPTRGGGGGGSSTSPLEDMIQEAERFAESMMTAQERQAAELQEMVNLRRQLIAVMGEENEVVQRLDVAIQRHRTTVEEFAISWEGVFSTLSDEIASNIEDWDSWGSAIRSIGASLVRQFGPGFFTSLLTGGNPFGNFGGNVAAKVLHDGRGTMNRQVSPYMFAGAPRLHNGLMSDEFPAILQRGETVIPKGFGSSSGPGITIQNSYDFRGVDPSMKEYLTAQIEKMDKEFPAKWLQTARRMQANRIKV